MTTTARHTTAMHRVTRWRVGSGLLCLVLAACGTRASGDAAAVRDTAGADTAAPPSVSGASWRLLHWFGAGAGGATVPVRSAVRFAEGRMSGTGGCNRIAAPYREGGDSLVLEAVVSTQMSCGDSADLQERRFVATLQQVRRFARRGDTLDLLGSAAADSLMRLVAEAPRPLVGTTWNATGINNGRGGVASLVAGSAVTATFSADGRLAGSAGCNRYTASYTTGQGDSLGLGAGAATKRMCADPGVMQQEQQFLAVFPQVARFAIDHDVLEWRSASGALLARFTAQP